VHRSHAELAAAVGTSRKFISRQLTAMANDHLLEVRRGAVRIVDFETLLRLSSPSK